MSAGCCDHGHEHADAAASSPAYKRILWIALAVNLAMFVIEIGAGVAAQSVSLLADSLDMLGDALVYGFSLYVVARSMRWKAASALAKACSLNGAVTFRPRSRPARPSATRSAKPAASAGPKAR